MEYRYAIGNGDMEWIQLVNPSELERENIIKSYNIPRDYIQDVFDPYEVPRVEGLEGDKPPLFVFSYPIKSSETEYITRVVAIILLENTVITVRSEDSQVFDDLKEYALNNIKDKKDLDSMIVELAWSISKKYNFYIKEIDEKIQDFEDKIRNSTKTEFLQAMIEIQRALIYFRTGINENGLVIHKLSKLNYIVDTEKGSMLMHDLLKENKQAQIMIDTAVDMLENLTDLYSNVISNNLNTVMKVLTSITIVLTIPSIVGALWGMNTKLPIGNHPYAFWYLLSLIVVLSLIIVYVLRKNDYL